MFHPLATALNTLLHHPKPTCGASSPHNEHWRSTLPLWANIRPQCSAAVKPLTDDTPMRMIDVSPTRNSFKHLVAPPETHLRCVIPTQRTLAQHFAFVGQYSPTVQRSSETAYRRHSNAYDRCFTHSQQL